MIASPESLEHMPETSWTFDGFSSSNRKIQKSMLLKDSEIISSSNLRRSFEHALLSEVSRTRRSGKSIDMPVPALVVHKGFLFQKLLSRARRFSPSTSPKHFSKESRMRNWPKSPAKSRDK